LTTSQFVPERKHKGIVYLYLTSYVSNNFWQHGRRVSQGRALHNNRQINILSVDEIALFSEADVPEKGNENSKIKREEALHIPEQKIEN